MVGIEFFLGGQIHNAVSSIRESHTTYLIANTALKRTKTMAPTLRNSVVKGNERHNDSGFQSLVLLPESALAINKCHSY